MKASSKPKNVAELKWILTVVKKFLSQAKKVFDQVVSERAGARLRGWKQAKRVLLEIFN